MARHISRRFLPAFALVAVLAASLVSLAQTTSLRLVSTAWAPFTGDAGEPRLALDLVETALARSGIKAATTIVEPGQFSMALVSDAFDGSAAAWKDADRERALVFSDPYLENRLVLVARKGGDVSAATMSALAGKRVAVVAGYSYGEVGASGPVLVRTTGDDDSLRQLIDSRVDYALIDELVVHHIVDAYAKDVQERLQIGTAPLVKRALHVAIRRTRPDAASIIDRFNVQVRGLMADGTFHRLLQVDWLLADVDGDGVREYVPSGDRVGATAPQNVYTLVSPGDRTETSGATKSRFYLGGNIYEDWASVPQQFKTEGSQRPDYRRSTGSIFTFAW